MTKRLQASDQVSKTKGFTLLELLIVVAIIATLVLIALPIFRDIRERVMRQVAVTDLKNIDTAIQGYYSEKQAWPTSLNDPELKIATFKDPWGNDYVFRIADALPPPTMSTLGGVQQNIDYDLYSSGPNRVSTEEWTDEECSDDVVRYGGGALSGSYITTVKALY